MDDVGLVQTVLDLTGLSLGYSLSHIHGYGAGLGRGHQTAGAQHFTQTTNEAHHIRAGNGHIKVHPAALDLLYQVSVANDVSAGLGSSLSQVALGKYSHAHGFAGAVGQHHSATHLLDAALRKVLGDHVHQAGSYQDASITHFDFTHFSAVTPEELIRVQKIVNDKIFESMNVTVKEMPIEEAKKLGAMALFGEKYGKVVRVVDIEGWSTEFCGGTHVKNTAQIGGFKIVSESSVAAGIRRIEAVTGRNLLIRANMQEVMLHTVANTLKANNVAALPARAEAVMAENKAMSKELEDIKAKVAASKVTSLFDNAETVGDVKIASAYFTGTSGDTLRGMCDTIRDNAKAAAVAVLVGKSDDKITMAVTVTKDAQAKGLKAGNLVKEISAIAGGKGGGKPDFAMAGLKDETKIDEALAAVKSIVEKQLG